jgi:hypothetical protein
MKKAKLFAAVAFVLAIGSAFAPKAIHAISHSKDVTAFDKNACSTTRTCPDASGAICGYSISGCSGTVYKFN